MAVRTGLEPVISRVTGERDNHYTNEPWLREPDLNQQPLGYEPSELPDCSIPRRSKIDGGGKGIRTPAPISRPPGFQDRSLQPDLGIPPFFYGASGQSRTGTGFYTRRILSPVRLPIPPLRHTWCLAGDSNSRPLD